MNRYAQIALEQTRAHRPNEFEQIMNPTEHFGLIGELLAAEISQLRDQLTGSMKATESPEEFRQRSYQALATAEELVLANQFWSLPRSTATPADRESSEDEEADLELIGRYNMLSMINEAIHDFD